MGLEAAPLLRLPYLAWLATITLQALRFLVAISMDLIALLVVWSTLLIALQQQSCLENSVEVVGSVSISSSSIVSR